MKKKKGQGLPINMIIIAVIALLVLGVVVFIFYDQIKKIATGFSETREKAQLCQEGWLGGQKCIKSDQTCEEDLEPKGAWVKADERCAAEDEICCERKETEKKEETK